MLWDALQKLPDHIVMDTVTDPKKVLGQALVKAKHFIVKKLEETKYLPQKDK